jgi:hypothetical protein
MMPEFFDIEVTRDGRWWMIYVPVIDGLTQARHPGEVELMAHGTKPPRLQLRAFRRGQEARLR